MSGHSHAKTVKRVKEAGDKKRSHVFSKMAKLISVAAREGGSNPDFNPRLRTAVEKAKEFDLPADNIERAIKKGAGELEGAKLEEVVFEAYGPGGIAIIIEGITDNKNRTLSEIRQILSRHGAKLVGEGGLRWIFERKISGSGSLEWIPKQEIEIYPQDKESCQRLLEALDENEDVQEVYSNLKKET